MSAKAKMRPDHFERLQSALEGAPWDHDSLAEYVTQLSQLGEEDIFRRLGLGVSKAGTSAEMYEEMSAEKRAELRRWWHERARREAYHYEDLRTRLSWRYLL